MAPRTENAARNTHNAVERVLLAGRAAEERSGMRVLDLPCGSGAFTRRLRALGIEVVPADVEGGSDGDPAGLVHADMDRPLPFPDGSFTDLVCIDGIEHIERQFDFARECARVLGHSGRLVLSTPNISSARSRWRHLLTGHHNKCKTPLNEAEVTPLHHKSMISFPELRYLLHVSGFRIETVATNRVKAVSWLFAPLYPFTWLATGRAYAREEKDPGQRERNAEIRKAMHGVQVYFGETLIVAARRTAG